MRKIITLCGSYKFVNRIFDAFHELTSKGYIVLLPSFNCPDMTMDDKISLHFDRIEMSDAICVVTVNNYYGDHTKAEIDTAKKLGKEVMFMDYDKIG